MAQAQGLDLVLVSPADARPLVAKIMNHSKNKYDQQRRLREQRKNRVTISVKEIQLSPGIQENDIQTKLKHAKKFLSKGDHVKVTMKLKGRMITKQAAGRLVIQDFVKRLEDISEIKGILKLTERYFNVLLIPNKKEE